MKSFAVALLTAALPMALAAQQPAGAAPVTDPIATAFRGRIVGMHRNIAQAFDSIPEAKFDYKPTPSQLTVGFIAQHIASDSYLFCSNFGAMKPTLPAKDTETPDSVKAKWPKDTLVAKLKASFTFCQSALGQLRDSTISEPVTLTFGGNTRTLSRINMVLGHALDLSDHYSQIANYMRLNNLVPPSALPRPARAGN
ncbi:MAG TPA: DinB family protein [Gemmatimonadaceae bacterium]|jgi:hypothetical protein